MAQGNTVLLVGNLTADASLRYTPGGAAVANFGLAVNQRRQNRQSQEWEDRVCFFDVVCYGSLADNTAESIAKGTRVVVSGRLEQRSWETPQGERRSKVEVIADEVGPSLRWATCEVTRNERRGGDDAAYAGAARHTAGGGRNSNGGGAGGGHTPNQPPTYDYEADEPF